MKKLLRCLLLAFIIITASVRTVSADMGPKPSTYVAFRDLNGRTYYVTLFGEREDEASAHAIMEADYTKGETEEEKAYNVFLEYSLDDEFYFYGWGEFEKIDEDHDTYCWNYYSPDVFKIAVYSPEEDRLYVSDVLIKSGFDSYYTINANELNENSDSWIIEEEKTAPTKKNYGLMLKESLSPVIVTILVEAFIAFLFGYREKKQLLTVFTVNIITQLILNIIIVTAYYHGGTGAWLMSFLIGEIIIFVTEALIYMNTIGKDRKGKALIYAILANIITAGLTFLGGWIQ